MSETVILTQEEFDNLPEYSCSYPTGTTIGKKWKARWPYSNVPEEWYLREYTGYTEDGEHVSISNRRIQITGHPDPALWTEPTPQSTNELPVELL